MALDSIFIDFAALSIIATWELLSNVDEAKPVSDIVDVKLMIGITAVGEGVASCVGFEDGCDVGDIDGCDVGCLDGCLW